VYRFFLYRRIQVNLALLFCLHFCLFAFAFISPGNKAKSVGFSAKQSILFSGGSAVYQTGKLLYHIFSNPLFWICIVGIILTFPYLKNSFREKMGKKSMSLISEFSLLMLVVWLFHFGIRQWGGWVVPLRAENIIICITVLAIFTIVWNNSFLFLPFIGRKLDVSPAGKLLLMGSFIFLMIFNLFTADLFRSLVAAPVHLAIVNKRTEAIEMARLDNKHIVYFETYQKEIRNELQRMFSQKAADFISEEFVFPPPYIFLKYNRSVFEFDGAYAEYYGIDSIIIEGKVIRRYGLNDAALFR
jgi:hypothetical protein